MQESTYKVRKPASKVVLSRMQLTLHATRRAPMTFRTWCTQCLPDRVKNRRVPPFIVAMLESMVLRTTTMHHITIIPMPSPAFTTHLIAGHVRRIGRQLVPARRRADVGNVAVGCPLGLNVLVQNYLVTVDGIGRGGIGVAWGGGGWEGG